MSRGKKLLIVGLVLAVGLALAWPFRKSIEQKNYEAVAVAPADALQQRGPANQWVQPRQQETQHVAQTPQMGSPAPHVVAKMTSIGENSVPAGYPSSAESFDLANHPALASSQAPQSVSPVTPPEPPHVQPKVVPDSTAPAFDSHNSRQEHSRPTYATATHDQPFAPVEQRTQAIRHVVQNSDTLEKLAKRYLGDEGRALEIFDLNRDVLDNPHLLPINAELRIPEDAQVSFD